MMMYNRWKADLFVKQSHLFLGRLVSFDQFDSHFINAVHQCLVDNTKATLTEAALPALGIAANPDVVSAHKRGLQP